MLFFGSTYSEVSSWEDPLIGSCHRVLTVMLAEEYWTEEPLRFRPLRGLFLVREFENLKGDQTIYQLLLNTLLQFLRDIF